MCRWLAYSGSPILMNEVLYGGTNSLVDQSLHSRLGAEPTNGDGFGVGWYGDPPTPRASSTASSRRGTTRTCASWPGTSARRCSSPTSGRRSAALCSRPTATRSATTTGCSCTTATSTSSPRSSATSCSRSTRRCIPQIQGQADTEILFYLALTLGLEDDPPAAVARAIGLVEDVASRHDVPHPFQGTVATTDGESIWAFRYSSEHKSRSLFYTTDVPTLRKLYPEREDLGEFSDDARLIVSEPLGDVAGVWNEVPESSWGVIGPDRVDMQSFEPKAPAAKSVPAAV